ncbi:hypothetical protein [Sediminispirochaeta smaragdinae]|nr:hypothetical protein [Sediminispirochaeta smaragdinae]
MIQSSEMKTKLGFHYYLIPVIYLLLTGAFIHLETSGARQGFSYQVSQAAVSGTRSGGGVSATLKLFGSTIDLDSQVFGYIGDAAEPKILTLAEVIGEQQKIRVEYKEGLTLEISSSLRENSDPLLMIQALFPKESGVSRALITPESDWTLSSLDFLPARLLDREQGSVLIDLQQSDIAEDGTISFEAEGSRLVFFQNPGEDPVRYWFFQGNPSVSRDSYEKNLRDYLEKAYVGWKSGRYNPGSDTWSSPDDGRQFQESALVGMVAEGFRRRDTVDLNAIKGISTRHEENVTYLSAPYVGSLVMTDEARSAEASTINTKLRNYARSSNPALFSEVDHLAEYLLFSGDKALLREVSECFKTDAFEGKKMTALQLAGMVEVYVDVGNLYPERFPGYEELYGLIDSLLLPRLRRADDGLFLFDNDKVDVKATLEAGYYLQEIGRGENRALFEELGRTMVVSVLSLSDENGVLPATLSPLRNNEKERKEGYLLPEMVYPLLAENRYYPRHTFLYKELGSDVALWTVAQSISASRSQDAYTISFSFPTGSTHHMVIKNVPPFAYIELYGIRWNGTRQFQYYDAGGWYYDRSSRTLYLKVRHKRSREEVVIHFRDDTAGEVSP